MRPTTDKRRRTRVVNAYRSAVNPTKRLLCGKTYGVLSVQRALRLASYHEARLLVRECRRSVRGAEPMLGGAE